MMPQQYLAMTNSNVQNAGEDVATAFRIAKARHALDRADVRARATMDETKGALERLLQTRIAQNRAGPLQHPSMASRLAQRQRAHWILEGLNENRFGSQVAFTEDEVDQAMADAEPDEEDAPNIVLSQSGIISRAGPGFSHDVYDFPNADKEAFEMIPEIFECLKNTYYRHELLETTRMEIIFEGGVVGGVHDIFAGSPALIPDDLMAWINRKLPNLYNLGSQFGYPGYMLSRIYIVYANAPSGDGLDIAKKSVFPTHAHETNLCGAISLSLLAARQRLSKWRKDGQERLDLYGKPLDIALQIENPYFETVRKEWECMAKHKEAANFFSKTNTMRHAKARDLHTTAGFHIGVKVTDEDLAKMVVVLSERLGYECGLIVFRENMTRLYATHNGQERYVKFWFHVMKTEKNHYQAISSATSFMCAGLTYCHVCKESRDRSHVCEKSCARCKNQIDHNAIIAEKEADDPDYKHQYVECAFCTRKFVNAECLTTHIERTKCDQYWRCEKCRERFNSKEIDPDSHVCGQIKCRNCKTYELPWPKHQCFVQRKVPKPATKETKEGEVKLLFADIESTQDIESKDDNGKVVRKHVVNVVCTQKACGKEWDVMRTISDWVDELLKPKWRGYTVIFHNGSGYDCHLVGEEIVKRKLSFVPQFSGGSRLREMTVYPTKCKSAKQKIRFIDSMMFLGIPLASFTSAFGLKTKKGFYCHFANKSQGNKWHKLLKDIDREDFGYSMMNSEKQQEFMVWYTENAESNWDNDKELIDYCTADVTLLREGCMKFRQIVMDITNDKNAEETKEEKCEFDEDYDPKQARSEKKELALKQSIDPFSYSTIAAAAKAVFFAKHLPENEIAALPAWLVKRLTPAARGGRTDLQYMYWKAKPGQRGYYVDFTSLYPFVNRFGRYPVGHPVYTMHTDLNTPAKCKAFLDNTPGLGVLWADIKCPQNLRFPVLPMLRDGKLMFDLMDRVYDPKGNYDNAAPVTSLELQEALKQGYTVTKIHETCWWSQERHGIFSEYVNMFFKLKTEADGWPSKNMSPLEKRAYTDKFISAMGVHLSQDMTEERNNGLRSVAKMFLNSLWGKMGERLAYGGAEMLYEDDESTNKYLKLDRENQIENFNVISEECTVLMKKVKNVLDQTIIHDKNIGLAIFTTAQARLKLLKEFLQVLDHRVLYFDTDSCIFFCEENEKPEQFVKNLGTMLGEPTSETGVSTKWGEDKYGRPYYIVEFFSGGPKNYGYLMNDEYSKFKCKGQQTNRGDVAKQLAFEKARDAILTSTEIIVSVPSCIQRPKPFSLVSRDMKKVYRESWTKGNIVERVYNAKGELHAITTEPWNNSTKDQYAFLMAHLNKTPEKGSGLQNNARPANLREATERNTQMVAAAKRLREITPKKQPVAKRAKLTSESYRHSLAEANSFVPKHTTILVE